MKRTKIAALMLAACITVSTLPALAEQDSARPTDTPRNQITGTESTGNNPQFPSFGQRPEEGNRPGDRPSQMPGNGQPGQGPRSGLIPNTPGNEMPGGHGEDARPELPEGQAPQFPDSMSPDRQTGDAPEGNLPAPPSGGTPGMEHGNEPPARPNESGFPGNAPFQQAESMEYTAALTLSEDASGETYTSQTDGENALLVSASEVHVSDSTVEKTGSSTGESADFYGINAAVLAKDGANLYVSDATVTSSGTHANGIFSYGQGTSVTVSDTSIETTGDNSGGLMTTGGASMTANNVTVSTSGHSSAAIRSDRGGGKVTVNGGSFATSGVGSPAIYSTADITITDAVLESTASEAVVIEGGNSVTLINADLAGNNAILNGQSTEKTNVLIYQSMSGDAQEGSSTFTMVGGSLKSNTGSMFHVTNVSTAISLKGVDLTLSEDASTLLSATADSWGKSGSNGGHVQLTLSHQEAAGDIVTDAISSVTVTLSEGSSYTGAVNASQTGSASLSLDASSTWTLTGDSYLDAFEGDVNQINLNGYTLYVGGERVVSAK